MFFYLKMARLGFIEWSGSRSGLLAFCLFYAFWFWLWSRLLLTLAEPSATWGRQGLLLYIGLTQIIAGTALQGTAISEAMADFSVSLTKPRPWLLYLGTLIWGRQLGQRLLLLLVFLLLMPLLARNIQQSLISAGRLLCFLPLLGVIDTLYTLLLCCLRISYRQINSFRGTVVKMITLLGGAMLPLSELRVSWKTQLLHNPFADLIFQPGYWCLQGHFYQLTPAQWWIRITVQMAVLSLLVLITYQLVRRYHQSYGG